MLAQSRKSMQQQRQVGRTPKWQQEYKWRSVFNSSQKSLIFLVWPILRWCENLNIAKNRPLKFFMSHIHICILKRTFHIYCTELLAKYWLTFPKIGLWNKAKCANTVNVNIRQELARFRHMLRGVKPIVFGCFLYVNESELKISLNVTISYIKS